MHVAIDEEALRYATEEEAAREITAHGAQVGSFVRELSKTLGTEMEKQGLLG